MNKNTSVKIFRGFAWFAGVYHLILGLVGTLASGDTVVSIASAVYGITTTISPQFLYMAKFISAYMIAFGIMLVFIGSDPYRYRKLAWAAVVMFAIRIFDRLVFFSLLQEAFGVSMSKNLVTVVTVSIIALGLIVFMPREEKSA